MAYGRGTSEHPIIFASVPDALHGSKKEAVMKRMIFILGALLVPVLVAHLVLAAGLFRVGEKAPSFALTAITGETVGLDNYKGEGRGARTVSYLRPLYGAGIGPPKSF